MPARYIGKRAPADPAVIDQARDHEREEADRHPIRLFSPELRGHGSCAHVGRAVDGDDAEDGQRKHCQPEEANLGRAVFAEKAS